MSIGALNTSTFTPFLDPGKDPPWGPRDLDKLKLFMDQGIPTAEIAKQLGTTVSDVQQMVEALKQLSGDNAPAAASASMEATNQPGGNNAGPSQITGQNVDLKA